MQGSSGLNAQDRGIKSSVKNVPFVIRLAAPGAGVQGADECTQLMEGSSLPAEPHTAEQGVPLKPCVPTLVGAPQVPTHTGTPPNITLWPQMQIKLPALPYRGHPDPRPAPWHCSAPLLASPCPSTSFPAPLHGPSTPQSPSPVPLSLAPGTARITP